MVSKEVDSVDSKAIFLGISDHYHSTCTVRVSQFTNDKTGERSNPRTALYEECKDTFN